MQTFSSRLATDHPAWLSILLHLLPGLLTGAVYYLLTVPVAQMGLPSIAALIAAGVLVTIPFELGMIAWAARKSPNGPQPLRAMIAFREPIPALQYLAWVPGVLFATALIFSLFNPVTGLLQGLFAWLPETMQLRMGFEGGYSRESLIWLTVFNALLIAIIIPTVEELYFRGFLLPRMPQWGRIWTPLAHSFLFAAYHTWSPWMLIARTLGLLPLIYSVQHKRNLYIGILVHILVNLIDVFTMIAFIARMN